MVGETPSKTECLSLRAGTASSCGESTWGARAQNQSQGVGLRASYVCVASQLESTVLCPTLQHWRLDHGSISPGALPDFVSRGRWRDTARQRSSRLLSLLLGGPCLFLLQGSRQQQAQQCSLCCSRGLDRLVFIQWAAGLKLSRGGDNALPGVPSGRAPESLEVAAASYICCSRGS